MENLNRERRSQRRKKKVTIVLINKQIMGKIINNFIFFLIICNILDKSIALSI